MDVVLCVLMFAFGFFSGIWAMKRQFSLMEARIRDAEIEKKKLIGLLKFERSRFSPK